METTTEKPTSAPPRAQAPPVAAPQPAADAPAPRRSPVVRMILFGVGAVVVLLALIAGIRYLIFASAHETTDDAKIDSDQVQVTSKISERVAKISVDTNQYVHKGQLLIQLDDRDEKTKLASALAQRSAYQAQANAAAENVVLTRDQQAAQNQQGQGAIQSAQGGIASASAQTQSAQHEIDVDSASVAAAAAALKAAQGNVPGAQANLSKAQADLRRTISLVSTGDLSRAQLDSARAEEKSAQSDYDQALSSVNGAQAKLDSAQQTVAAQQATASGLQATIETNQGQLTTAQGKLAESSAPSRVAAQEANASSAKAQETTADAQVRAAQDSVSYTQIRAPIDGYVGQKSAEVGQTVSPGEVLMTVVPSNNIYITANYKETQMGRIRVGQPVEINVDAYNGVKFDGYVENISPASQNSFSLIPAQNASGNFVKVTQRLPVRIRF
jgi:membrane fusion protein (multidrug efflux system)